MDDVHRQLTPYLLPGETLRWTGRPDPGRRFDSRDLFLVPFSLLWAGFALTAVVTDLVERASLSSVLFGLPFVVLGLHLLVGRFVVKARSKRRTVYGLTEGRALVARGRGSLSQAPLQHSPVDQRRSRDGRHLTVTFGAATASSGMANTGLDPFDRGDGPLGFYDVRDVPGLEAALRGLGR